MDNVTVKSAKKITSVETVIDGSTYVFYGRLSADRKTLRLKKGMFLTVQDSDRIETKEVVEKLNVEKITKPRYVSDIQKWFNRK